MRTVRQTRTEPSHSFVCAGMGGCESLCIRILPAFLAMSDLGEQPMQARRPFGSLGESAYTNACM